MKRTATASHVFAAPPAGERLGPVAMGLTMAMMVLAPLLRGGNRGVALMVLEWLALAVAVALGAKWLAGVALPPMRSTAQRLALWLLVLSPVWLLALQFLTGSLQVPQAAVFSALAGMPVAVCLLVAWLASGAQAGQLRKLWVWVALAQAVFGLSQLTGVEALYFGLADSGYAIGTFASRNTYANLLVMAMPLVVWQFMAALAGDDHARRRGRQAAWGWGFGVFTLMVTVMLTTSRTGIVTGLLVFVLSVWVLAPRRSQSRWNAWGWPAGAVALVVVALLAGGLDWAARFDAERLATDYDIRAAMRDAAAGAAWAQLPLGSGLGSFAWVSTAFQPAGAGAYWFDLAHNDYMQLLAETGMAGALLIAAALFLFLNRGWVLLRLAGSSNAQTAREAKAALAGGLGLLAFGLHAWVDYPFHIPANAMMAATLLGLMCRNQSAEAVTAHQR